MANELRLQLSFNFRKSSISAGMNPGALLVTVTGDGATTRILPVAITGTSLDLGGITTPGWLVGFNADAANFVTIAPNNADAALVKVNAGEWFLFRVEPTATPYLVADTAPVDIEYTLLEN